MRLVGPVLSLLFGCTTLPKSWWHGDGKVVVTPSGVCHHLNPEMSLHPIVTCARPKTYDVTTPQRQYVYERKAFEDRLKSGLIEFLGRTEYPGEIARVAKVEVWVQAPIFQPHTADFLVVWRAATGSFAIPLPLAPDAWQFRDEAVVRLSGDGDITRGIFAASAVVLVEAKPGVTPEAYQNFLATADLGLIRGKQGTLVVRDVKSHWPVSVVRTTSFADAVVAARLKAIPKARFYLRDIRPAPAQISEAYLAKMGEFTIRP